MITEVVVYVTTDGTRYSSRADAEAHEARSQDALNYRWDFGQRTWVRKPDAPPRPAPKSPCNEVL